MESVSFSLRDHWVDLIMDEDLRRRQLTLVILVIRVLLRGMGRLAQRAWLPGVYLGMHQRDVPLVSFPWVWNYVIALLQGVVVIRVMLNTDRVESIRVVSSVLLRRSMVWLWLFIMSGREIQRPFKGFLVVLIHILIVKLIVTLTKLYVMLSPIPWLSTLGGLESVLALVENLLSEVLCRTNVAPRVGKSAISQSICKSKQITWFLQTHLFEIWLPNVWSTKLF
jgi:hypothetical protein